MLSPIFGVFLQALLARESGEFGHDEQTIEQG
jgi:hypothetical protein